MDASSWWGNLKCQVDGSLVVTHTGHYYTLPMKYQQIVNVTAIRGIDNPWKASPAWLDVALQMSTWELDTLFVNFGSLFSRHWLR